MKNDIIKYGRRLFVAAAVVFTVLFGANHFIDAHFKNRAEQRASEARALKEKKDREALARGMPEGYYLQCNEAGQYRPVRERYNLPLIWAVENDGTKAGAIRRAWSQFEHEKLESEPTEAPGTWHRCEEAK